MSATAIDIETDVVEITVIVPRVLVEYAQSEVDAGHFDSMDHVVLAALATLRQDMQSIPADSRGDPEIEAELRRFESTLPKRDAADETKGERKLFAFDEVWRRVSEVRGRYKADGQ